MPKPIACPSCRAPMDQRPFASAAGGEEDLDLCWDCSAVWFDRYESTQLAPGAVIDLFRLIHDHRDHPPRPFAAALSCPRCSVPLVLTHDLQRTNRLLYHRCPQCRGRLTSFFQFLREKQFVRSPSPAELERLKALVRQVRCSSCGAPVDIERDAACSYCHAPLAILDTEVVARTLAALSEAERSRAQPDPQKVASAFESLLASRRGTRRQGAWTRDALPGSVAPAMIDLVVEGIGRLFD